jgi:hypothetical protein
MEVTVFTTQIGEAFVGPGAEAAHLNSVPGAGAARLPTLDEALEHRDRALNAYYLPPGVT